MRPAKATTGNAVPGVIETLSNGFEQVNRVLWVVALPILMDLFLWLGPQVSAAPVFERLIGWYNRLTQSYLATAAGNVDATTLDQARQALTSFQAQVGHGNLLTLLVANVASLPSMLPPAAKSAPTVQIASVGALIGVVLATQIVGIFLGCVYLGALGQQIRDGRVALPLLGRRVWFYWLSVIGFLLIVIGLALVISIPVGLAIGLVELIAPAIGVALWAVAVAAAQIGAILLMLYLFFLVDAIVVSEVGPVQAAIKSFRVVANNFWPSVGFIVLIYVISLGMQEIWKAMSQNPVGTFIAIVGNAYIASGLTAASLLYYKTRIARLPASSEVVGRVTQV